MLMLLFLFACESDVHYKYGIEPIHSIERYYDLIQTDDDRRLVNIESLIPTIILDIRYATDNNFVEQPVYNLARAFCRKPVAMALKNAQEEFLKSNLSLKIFDAYRPYSVTMKFYELYPDTTYVASPYSGSRHNRGAAVDVTLVDLNSGRDLDMGTEYDDFRTIAHPDYDGLPAGILKNRKILMDVMQKHGFTVYHSEWWHFDYQDWDRFELLDISFEDLETIDEAKQSVLKF